MLAKDQVNYRKALDWSKRCGVCTMFREPNGCTLVRGIIDKHFTCDRFDPKHDEAIKRRMT